MTEGPRTVETLDRDVYIGENASEVVDEGLSLLDTFAGQSAEDIRTPLREYLERHATAISNYQIATYRRALYREINSCDWGQLTYGLCTLLVASGELIGISRLDAQH